uniref:Uncharacterized protein n=1 Tax=Romanomermis culicivorax TaxID=13658 RepID=A0A915IXS8_ROMCU
EDPHYWKNEGLLLNHTAGILFGCPSLKYGQLWTFESINEDQNLKSIDDFLSVMNITGLIFLSSEQILNNPQKIIELHSFGNELGFFIDTNKPQLEIISTIEDASKALSNISNEQIKAKFVRIIGPKFRNATKEAKKLGFTVVQWTSAMDFSSNEVFETAKFLENLKNGPPNGGIFRLQNVQNLGSDDAVMKLKLSMENSIKQPILNPTKCFRVFWQK